MFFFLAAELGEEKPSYNVAVSASSVKIMMAACLQIYSGFAAEFIDHWVFKSFFGVKTRTRLSSLVSLLICIFQIN